MIKVDCIYLPVNMALALFHKHLKKLRNIFERGIGEIGFFLIELPIVLPIVLPIGLPIGSAIALAPVRVKCVIPSGITGANRQYQ